MPTKTVGFCEAIRAEHLFRRGSASHSGDQVANQASLGLWSDRRVVTECEVAYCGRLTIRWTVIVPGLPSISAQEPPAAGAAGPLLAAMAPSARPGNLRPLTAVGEAGGRTGCGARRCAG